MPTYCRMHRPGGTYFITLITQGRAPIFAADAARRLLRAAIERCATLHPFSLDAIVLLPDHLHLLMTLPADDSDYQTRVMNLKAGFTRAYLDEGGAEQPRSASRLRQRARGVWLKRFWEHTIRDETDRINHVHYICYNPVKHGLARCPHEWPYSSFHRLAREKRYTLDWCCQCESTGPKPAPPLPAIEAIAEASGE